MVCLVIIYSPFSDGRSQKFMFILYVDFFLVRFIGPGHIKLRLPKFDERIGVALNSDPRVVALEKYDSEYWVISCFSYIKTVFIPQKISRRTGSI